MSDAIWSKAFAELRQERDALRARCEDLLQQEQKLRPELVAMTEIVTAYESRNTELERDLNLALGEVHAAQEAALAAEAALRQIKDLASPYIDKNEVIFKLWKITTAFILPVPGKP